MNIEVKYLGKCTWTTNTLSEKPLVPTIQWWKCSSKEANDSCLFNTQLWLESEPQFFWFNQNYSPKTNQRKEALQLRYWFGGLKNKSDITTIFLMSSHTKNNQKEDLQHTSFIR